MALFLVVLVLLGFGPSFYLRGVVPSFPRPNPTLPPTVSCTAASFTLWMAAIVAQTQLISRAQARGAYAARQAAMLLALLIDPGDVPDRGVAGRARQPAAVHRPADLDASCRWP